MRGGLHWTTQAYRGMYVHALAIQVAEERNDLNLPGPRWSYLMAVGYAPRPSREAAIDAADDLYDYYTRDAAEQAALHCGRLAIDVIHGLG